MLSNVFIFFVAAYETTSMSITCTLLAIALEQYSQDALVKASPHGTLGHSCGPFGGAVGGDSMRTPGSCSEMCCSCDNALSNPEVGRSPEAGWLS